MTLMYFLTTVLYQSLVYPTDASITFPIYITLVVCTYVTCTGVT